MNEAPAGDPRAWRRTLAAGRFETASRERLIAVGEGHETADPAEAAAVKALTDVQGLLRDKSWQRAKRRLADLDERPPLVDWPALEEEVEALLRAGTALDRREVDEALAALHPDPEDARREAAGTEPPDPEPAAEDPAAEDPATSVAISTGPRLLEAEHATLLGTALVLDGRSEEAEVLFARALALDPKHHRAMVNLGNVALEAGRTDEAIDLYERALALDEDFPNAHHNLGVAYRRKGQIGKSVRALRRAQKADRTRESTDARESVRSMAGSLRAKRVRWLLWAAVAAGVVWLLMTRG